MISSNKPFFANGFVIAFASHFSLQDTFFFFIAFFKPTKFSTNQLTEHSSRQSGDYLPGLILVVNILLWSNTVFIITWHGLHGKPASYIYTGAVISSNSMGLQNCLFFAKNNYIIMGTMLPCNRLADTFDVDMPSCIICSSCGHELSKILSEMKNSSSATAVVPSGGI